MEKLRICLYGGPGLGKSTTAAYIFAALKMKSANIELVTEYVKGWAYEKKHIEGWDQVYIFGKQLHRESFLFKHGVDIIVTDSPLLMQYCYSHHLPYGRNFLELAKEFEKEYLALHIILKRESQYIHRGRYETEEQAIERDKYIDTIVRINAKGPIWESSKNDRENLVTKLCDYLSIK